MWANHVTQLDFKTNRTTNQTYLFSLFFFSLKKKIIIRLDPFMCCHVYGWMDGWMDEMGDEMREKSRNGFLGNWEKMIHRIDRREGVREIIGG